MPLILQTWLLDHGTSPAVARFLALLAALAVFALLAALANWLANRWLLPLTERLIKRTSVRWDDTLATHGFFQRLARLLPVLILYFSADLLLPPPSRPGELVRRLALVALVIVSVRILDALLHAVHDLIAGHRLARGKPIKGYLQAVSIVAYVTAAIFIISILTDKSPWGLLTFLGGLTAVLILVFKDTLLGLVASIQIAALDMIRVGDWIEAPKYGADGDVIDVTIHTVKVRNWDKTIATIPTYALVSDSFKNWRGMQESGGRRIKRAVYIDMNSIRFCTDQMLEEFKQIDLLRDYIEAKQQEIETYNREHQVNPARIVNGRRQTNIGVFRAYVTAYLRHHPKIHQEMTFLVRHLQPSPQGLPLEIYVFSKDQVWAHYEAIQADIFDHILAAIPEFELRVFQYPAGHDLRALTGPARAALSPPEGC